MDADDSLFELVFLSGASRGVRMRFPGMALLGRDRGNSITIAHPGVALLHALITYDGQKHVLMDAGSITGTRLNGIRLTAPHPLMNGDIVSLGTCVHLVYLHSSNADETSQGRSRYDPPPLPFRHAHIYH